MSSKTPAAIETALFEALGATIETVAFEEPIPISMETLPDVAGIRAEIELESPALGGLTLWLSKTAAEQIAANIEGEFDPALIPDERVLDAISELSNVLLGCLAGKILDSTTAFRLGLPKATFAPTTATPGGVAYAYEIGGEPVVITLDKRLTVS